ncbi:MAG: HTTM domain-containing protein [Polyangiaceae bacterium]|nr:HTTM domain-containing protein [Polyangiaceae bacterium]
MKREGDLWQRFLAWGLLAEGSTRPAAIMRMGIMALVWAKWAEDFALFHQRSVVGHLINASAFASTIAFFVGAFTRFSGAWASLSLLTAYGYFGLHLGMRQAFVHHHTRLLLVTTVLVALMPSGRSLSFDRYRAVTRAAREGQPPPPERGPLWAQRLLAIQVSLLYFFTAGDKLRPSFLSGDRLEQIYAAVYGGPDFSAWFGYRPLVVASAIATVAIEYALAFGLWVPRWRRVLIPLGVAFHVVLYYTLPISTFTATMCLLYLAFLDPDRVHATIDALLGHGQPAARQAQASSSERKAAEGPEASAARQAQASSGELKRAAEGSAAPAPSAT